jgi:hypothetical protein
MSVAQVILSLGNAKKDITLGADKTHRLLP